jgi:hypothetical protein
VVELGHGSEGRVGRNLDCRKAVKIFHERG